MKSILSLLQMIEKKPPMYLGGRSIFQLQAFLDGWCYGVGENLSDPDFLDNFYTWLAKKYKITSTQSWGRIILFYSQDEVDALDNFFDLLNIYIGEESNQEA